MKPRAGRASDRYIIGPRLFVLLLEQQGLHVRVGLRAVEYDEAIHHRAPMRSKGDADTNQLKVGGLFQLPRSLTDAGYGSAVAAPGQRPVAFMILKMGRPSEITSSLLPSRSPPITVPRRAMGSQLDGPPARSARGVARGNFKSGVVAYFIFRGGKSGVG